MKTILVPVDFSDTSINAVRYAAQLAVQINGKVMMLHAYQYPVIHPVNKGMELTDEGVKEINLKELARIKQVVESEIPLVKLEYLIINGELRGVINVFAENFRTDLIVMGLSGAGKVKELLIGSNTLDVAANTTIPVIIVPKKSKFKPVEKIALATDFRDVVANIPDTQVKLFLAATGARLHIVNVDYQHEYATVDTPMQSGLLEAMFQSWSPEYHFVEDYNVQEGLSRYIEANNINILIVVPHKQNMLHKLFMPNHTKQLVFHSKVPVMVVHE
ncbi:MAG: universal stress protein [Sphingobacteriales bacterium]|nr:MAG: universal stress protein [Sphingobacteriales bacterium]